MRSSNLIAMVVIVLAGCGREPEVVSETEQPELWASCARADQCPVSENCYDTGAVGGETGTCFKRCNDNETGCIEPVQCTSAQPYCCRSVACIQNQLTDPNAKLYYIVGIEDGCHTGVSCAQCPAGKVRNRDAPGDPACCQPTPNCAGHCGVMNDTCGWPEDCGACPAGQICTGNNCCAPIPQNQACAGHCGTVSNGCGGSYNCGGCGQNQYCGPGNICYCAPIPQNQACAGHCGTVSDGCGGSYSCGGCGQNRYCGSGNHCYCSPGYQDCGDGTCRKNCP